MNMDREKQWYAKQKHLGYAKVRGQSEAAFIQICYTKIWYLAKGKNYEDIK